jgi:hypothetical protein
MIVWKQVIDGIVVRIMALFLAAGIEPRWLILTVLTNRCKGSMPANSPNTSKFLDPFHDAFDMPSWGHSFVLGAAVGEALRLVRCIALAI